MQLKVDIAIVGNGILACALAESLKGSGKTCAVIGPSDRPDSASVAAAAMLNAFAELGEGALDHEIHRYKFAKSCEASQAWPGYLKSLQDQSGIEIPLIQGTGLVQTGPGSMAHYQAVKSALDEHQQNYREDDNTLFLEQEGSVEPNLLFEAFNKILTSHEKIHMVEGFVYKLDVESEVKTIYTHSGDQIQAEQIVLASGVHVNELCQKTKGLERVMQLFKGRGLAAHLYLSNHGLESTLRTCHEGAHCGVYLIPYDEDRLFLGATSELMLEAEDRNKRVELNHLLDRASEFLMPNLRDAQIQKVLLGYRPVTADAMPIIGETSVPGVWVMSGTKRDGFHMVPVIAKEVSQSILNQREAFDGKFHPEREIMSYLDGDKMLTKAEAYFGCDRSTAESRWQSIKETYPTSNLQSVEPELWPIFENQWFKA